MNEEKDGAWNHDANVFSMRNDRNNDAIDYRRALKDCR
jgi:hypothetical protein